jgi:hypothetical protein
VNAVVLRPASPGVLSASLTPVVSKALSRLVIGLLVAHTWLAQSTLSVAQIGVELLIGGVLITMLAKTRLLRSEIALLLLLGASIGASLVINPVPVTLLFAKVFGLAVVSLLVFSRYRFDTSDALWVISLNVVLTFWQYLFGSPSWFLAIVATFGETWRDFAQSRPLGLFMSTHVSAALSALMFLWLGRNKAFAAFGLLSLVVSGSTNVILAYAGQTTQRILEWLRIEKLAVALGLVAILLLVGYAQTVLHLDLTQMSGLISGREQVSYSIIMSQLASPEYYTRAFTLLPGNPRVLYNEASGDWPNEIGYLATLQQGGFILGAAYLSLLLYRIRGFRVFMAMGMLHFGMQTIPLAVFLLLQWSESMNPRPDAPGTVLRFVPARALP